jgi:murein lipoprotein
LVIGINKKFMWRRVMRKSLRLVAIVSVMLWLGMGLVGCATSSQVKDLQTKTDQAMSKADKALMEAENAKAAAAKASSVADDASAKADKAAAQAEECSMKCEKMFNKKMMK